jgi:hypothetical protein
MTDLELMKQAIARTAAQEELGSKDRALLDRLLDNIAELERKRGPAVERNAGGTTA